jgi:hypothetical protein
LDRNPGFQSWARGSHGRWLPAHGTMIQEIGLHPGGLLDEANTAPRPLAGSRGSARGGNEPSLL